MTTKNALLAQNENTITYKTKKKRTEYIIEELYRLPI